MNLKSCRYLRFIKYYFYVVDNILLVCCDTRIPKNEAKRSLHIDNAGVEEKVGKFRYQTYFHKIHQIFILGIKLTIPTNFFVILGKCYSNPEPIIYGNIKK